MIHSWGPFIMACHLWLLLALSVWNAVLIIDKFNLFMFYELNKLYGKRFEDCYIWLSNTNLSLVVKNKDVYFNIQYRTWCNNTSYKSHKSGNFSQQRSFAELICMQVLHVKPQCWVNWTSWSTQMFGIWGICLLAIDCKKSVLTLAVLNFWKFTSYCSSKPLWSGMGEVVPARTSPTLHPPSPPTVHQLSWLAH